MPILNINSKFKYIDKKCYKYFIKCQKIAKT